MDENLESMEAMRERLRQILPPELHAEALRLLEEGKRIPSLHAGKITIPDDFDDPLPDEFWGDLFVSVPEDPIG